MSSRMEGEDGCLELPLNDHKDRDDAIRTQQAIRNYWAEKKRKHRQLLKDTKATISKGKDSLAENASNATTIIERKVVDYFNVQTKHITNEEKKVVLYGILNDPSIKDLVDCDGLNANLSSILVANLRNSFVSMNRSEDDLVLKRSSLMMLLNSDVDDINISELSKVIGVSRKTVYNTLNRIISSGEGTSLLKLTTRCKPMTPITSEIKDVIIMFWFNESRVSPNKKDLCRKRVGRNQYEEHPIHLLDVPQVFTFILTFILTVHGNLISSVNRKAN